jgi:NitT/TauT family transport system permease protein
MKGIKVPMLRKRSFDSLLPFIVFIGVILMCEMVILLTRIPHYVVPAPHAIIQGFIDNFSQVSRAILFTMSEVIIGFFIGSALGLLIALCFFYFSIAEKMFIPIISAVNSVPMIAFAPIAVLWFGTGQASKIFLAVISSFFTVMVNTLQGLRTSDPLGVDLMKSFGASEKEIFFKYRWPYALHHVFIGLRNASTIAVIVAVISEMLGSPEGVGLIINVTQQTADFLLMWVATIGISIVGVIFYLIILAIERRTVWWTSSEL